MTNIITTPKVNLKEKSILVLDHGLFFEVALKLADYYGKVYYFSPYQSAYPEMDLAVIGTEWKNGKQLPTFDGKNVERIENPYDYLDEIDIAYSTDVYYGSFIEMLEKAGIPCVGAGKGECLELDRYNTAKEMKALGMDVANTVRLVGMDALRKYLQENDNKWVKISRYRAEFETFHHNEYYLSEPLLDKLQMQLGALKNIVEFIVVDNIDAVVEEGVDTYTVNGKYPEILSMGTEIKDVAYCMKLTKTSDISIGNKTVNDKFAKLLKKYDYQGFFSTEVRTTKDKKFHLIDPTTRQGLPSTFSYMELFDNFGEIVWGLGHGEIVNPKYKYEYGMEVLISSGWISGTHQSIYFPPEIRKWLKLLNPIKIDGKYHIIKTGESVSIGSLVAIGNSHEECAKKIRKMAELIKGYEINIKTDGIEQAIEAFETMIKLSKK
jgi:hypothetical protein